MKYFQIIYRTGQEEFATKELLITADQHLTLQNALANGEDFVIIPGRATIKRTSIVSINEADSLVSEYQRNGTKIDGLPELEAPEEPKMIGKSEDVKEMIKRKSAEIRKKMGWDEENK